MNGALLEKSVFVGPTNADFVTSEAMEKQWTQ